MRWQFVKIMFVRPSRILESDVKTVRDICVNFSGCMVPSGGQMFLHFSGVHDARGAWHVPSREGLQKVLHAPTGRTGGTADSILAGHTCATQTCVLL